MATFNEAVAAFGKAHDAIREAGEGALAIRYIDLVSIARLADEMGGSVSDGEWREAYDAAYRANQALRTAAYKVAAVAGLAPPAPKTGPSIFIA